MQKPAGQVFEVRASAPPRQPRILDVLRAVKAVAHLHPEVIAWWYAPPQRLRLGGALPSADRLPVEVAVEPPDAEVENGKAFAADLARELGVTVAVRGHRGGGEGRKLFRLLSAAGPVVAV